MIPYGRQDVTSEDIDAVCAVLKSDYLTQGPVVPKFEEAVAQRCKAKHACALSSATAALHIACLALDLGEGDWLWTSPITFVASANCGIYCGAKVDFVDIDPATFNMCPDALELKLRKAEKEARLPKVVIPVHMGGKPCNMRAIHKLSKKYGFFIIEDASHAIGGRYLGEPVGNCAYSDITVFSFHPVKIITTGEGGMTLTNNDKLASAMNLLRSHGITRDAKLMNGESDGPWYYQQLLLGFNYRMTEIQAALGLSQLERLEEYVSIRHKLVDNYEKAFGSLPVSSQKQTSDDYSAYHLYILCFELDRISKTHREVFEFFREHEILVNLHYIPVHLQPYYASKGFRAGDFPQAERYYSRAITLPLFPTMSTNDQTKVIRVLKEITQ